MSNRNTNIISTLWFAATEELNVEQLKSLVSTHGHHLFGLQRSDPIKFDEGHEAKTFLGSDTTGMTAIHIAILASESVEATTSSVRRDETLEFLIANSTLDQLRIRWGQGNTALHLASFLGDVDVVKSLLAKGVPPQLKNDLSFAPIDVAHDDATSNVFQENAILNIRPKHRRLHSSSTPINHLNSVTSDNSDVVRSRTINDSEKMPVIVTEMEPNLNVSDNYPKSMVNSENIVSDLKDKPITFTGKYVKSQFDKEEMKCSPVAHAISTAQLTGQSTNNVGFNCKRSKRPKLVGVNLKMLEDVLDDASESLHVTMDDQMELVDPVITSTELSKQILPKEHSQIVKNPTKPKVPSLESNVEVYFKTELSGIDATPVIKPVDRTVTQTSNKNLATNHDSPKVRVNRSEKGSSSGIPPPVENERPSENVEVDTTALDFSAIRANFVKMVEKNPQLPKNPTESLAGMYAMAAVNGDPDRKKWRSSTVKGAETSRVQNGSDGESSLIIPPIKDVRLAHQKCDSGVEYEGAPSVFSQTITCESNTNSMLSKGDKILPFTSKVEQQSSCDEEIVNDSIMTSLVETPQIVSLSESISLPTLKLDLDLGFGDLDSCFRLSDLSEYGLPETSSTFPNTSVTEVTGGSPFANKNSMIVNESSDLGENERCKPLNDTIKKEISQLQRSHPLSLKSTPTLVVESDNNANGENLQDHVTRSKQRSPSAATIMMINSPVPSTCHFSRPNSPKGKKQVTFTQFLNPDKSKGEHTEVSSPISNSFFVMFKVTQICGLEWVLTERQMCHVLVCVHKEGLGIIYASRPYLVLSDKVTLHEEASFIINSNDKLTIELKLRMERRQQPKHSILSGLKFVRKEDPIKDIMEEILTKQPFDVARLISQTFGKIENSCLNVSGINSNITFNISSLILPTGHECCGARTMNEAQAKYSTT